MCGGVGGGRGRGGISSLTSLSVMLHVSVHLCDCVLALPSLSTLHHTHTSLLSHPPPHTPLTHLSSPTIIQCLEFLISSGVSPQNNGFTGVEILSDNSFETSLDFSEDVPPPPSLLHQAVLCHCGHGEGVRDVDVLEKLLPQLKDELESVDSQGKKRGEGECKMLRRWM